VVNAAQKARTIFEGLQTNWNSLVGGEDQGGQAGVTLEG